MLRVLRNAAETIIFIKTVLMNLDAGLPYGALVGIDARHQFERMKQRIKVRERSQKRAKKRYVVGLFSTY